MRYNKKYIPIFTIMARHVLFGFKLGLFTDNVQKWTVVTRVVI